MAARVHINCGGARGWAFDPTRPAGIGSAVSSHDTRWYKRCSLTKMSGADRRQWSRHDLPHKTRSNLRDHAASWPEPNGVTEPLARGRPRRQFNGSNEARL